MRPQNETARERLEVALRKSAPVSAADLSRRLDVSVPTVLRILREREERVTRIGTTKTARYALRRPLRGIAKPIPVYRVDAAGKGHSCGTLELVEPQGSIMNLKAMGWPLDRDHHNGWWDGLPCPLYDMRPQGFIGRNFAHYTHRNLGVSPNPEEWSDDDVVYALSRHGSDTTGNLIVGDQAYELWLASVANPEVPLPEAGLDERYVELADRATSQGVAGSSAAGEFPKFTIARQRPGCATPHAVVKFSGADDSTAVRRWADLLVCEHLALAALGASPGLRAAPTRVLCAQGRTFLDVERFDRHGMFGRSETLTLESLNAALLGSNESAWPELVKDLTRLKLTAAGLEEEVRVLWWYGRLIANTDMHLGNLSFSFEPKFDDLPRLRLAPAYDMLPMLYAPLSGGEVPGRTFDPVLPLPRERGAWQAACNAALVFWMTASQDPRISQPFKKICAGNHERLTVLAQRV